MERGNSWRATQELSSFLLCYQAWSKLSPSAWNVLYRSPRKASLLRGKAAHFLVLWHLCSSSVPCFVWLFVTPGNAARFRCPSPSPGIRPNSCPSSWWCHPTISSSDTPFSSCFQSFPASVSFPVNLLFASGGQSTGVSASASVLPMNIQGWFPLGLTGLISLQSKGLSRNLSSTTVRKHQFFGTQPSLFEKVFKPYSAEPQGKPKNIGVGSLSLLQPSPVDLPDLGIETWSPALQADFYQLSYQG